MFTLYKVSKIISSNILFSSYSILPKTSGYLKLTQGIINKVKAQDAQTGAQLQAAQDTQHPVIGDKDPKTGNTYFHTISTTSEKKYDIQFEDKQNPGKIETIEKKPELITKNEIANNPGKFNPKDQLGTPLNCRVVISDAEVQAGGFQEKPNHTLYANMHAQKIDSLVDGNGSKDPNTDIKV